MAKPDHDTNQALTAQRTMVEEVFISRTAYVVGKVEYREGEGILLEIRPGSAEIVLTSSDAIVGWLDGCYRGEATMPLETLCRYVAEGAIRFEP
jgi:hypothetical protein